MSPRILTGKVFLPKQRHRHNLPLDTGQIDVALKILLPMAFLANALLKFIRVHRLFGYYTVLMAAILNKHDTARHCTAWPRPRKSTARRQKR